MEYRDANPVAMAAGAARRAARRALTARTADNAAVAAAARSGVERRSAETVLADTVQAFVDTHGEVLGRGAPAP